MLNFQGVVTLVFQPPSSLGFGQDLGNVNSVTEIAIASFSQDNDVPNG